MPLFQKQESDSFGMVQTIMTLVAVLAISAAPRVSGRGGS